MLLQATEIEKARSVARRALRTINFREEQEKLNVWLALLNLEHRFGTKVQLWKSAVLYLQNNCLVFLEKGTPPLKKN